MPKHIQRRATRQRTDFAGSLRDGAYFRQGGVAKALWWTGTTAPSAPTPGGNPSPPNASLVPEQTLSYVKKCRAKAGHDLEACRQ